MSEELKQFKRPCFYKKDCIEECDRDILHNRCKYYEKGKEAYTSCGHGMFTLFPKEGLVKQYVDKFGLGSMEPEKSVIDTLIQKVDDLEKRLEAKES